VSDRDRGLARDGHAVPNSNRGLDRAWRLLGHQLRHPTGVMGSLAGRLMAVVNDRPNQLAIEALAPGPKDTVLEMGFGPGRALRVMAAQAPGSRLFGLDQSDRMLRQAARLNRAAIAAGGMKLIKGPFSPLPWSDDTFDKILLVNVAYFFDPAGNDMAEVFRVLKTGGRLVVYVTARETMEKWPFSGPDTHRIYSAAELQNLLLDAGFQAAALSIRTPALPFGVCGLLAIAEKDPARPSVTG
jgi:SAM-dependent methyltransferase